MSKFLDGLVIMGPTASGKSGLALRLAQRLHGVIICADSLQVYAGLPILTAQPTREDREKVRHMLYEKQAPSDPPCSAALWRRWAHEAVCHVRAEGRLPILVGGTGFYIKSFLEGLAPMPDVPRDVIHDLEALTTEVLAEKLRVADPVMAGRIHPSDRQRLVRALSVWQSTGRSLAFWQCQQPTTPSHAFRVCVLNPPKEVVNDHIHRRLHQMWGQGVMEEVAGFAQAHLSPITLQHHSMCEDKVVLSTRGCVALLKGTQKVSWPPITQCLGFAEILLAVHKVMSESYAQKLVALRTRQYAKRQRTWLRHQCVADFLVEGVSDDTVDALIQQIVESR